MLYLPCFGSACHPSDHRSVGKESNHVLRCNVFNVGARDFLQVLKANFPFDWQIVPRVSCLEICLDTPSATFTLHQVPSSVICAFAIHAVASKLMIYLRTLWDLNFLLQEFKDKMLPYRERIRGMYAEIPPCASLDTILRHSLPMIHISHQA